MVTQILKTWICHLIKTVLFYLNNYENKVFNNRTEYSNCLQHTKNHHLLSPASSICDVVRQRDTCAWLFYFPNIYGWVLGYGVESVSKIPRIPEFELFCMQFNDALIRWHVFKTSWKQTVAISSSKPGCRAFNSATVWNFHGLVVESYRFQQLTGSEKVAWCCWKSRYAQKRAFCLQNLFLTEINWHLTFHLTCWLPPEQGLAGLDETFALAFVSILWFIFWGVEQATLVCCSCWWAFPSSFSL